MNTINKALLVSTVILACRSMKADLFPLENYQISTTQ